MYPFLPESSADLVPLPQVDGPKLKPFNFHGPQKIEFLEWLGSGLHSQVFKIRIREEVYALKLFRFVEEGEWYGPPVWAADDLEVLEVIGAYAEPFNAECRAFGRLKESGHAELAVDCFGYLLLDDEHERIVMNQFSHLCLDFNGSSEGEGYWDLRGRFSGKDGRLPPIRGIVKEFGQEAKKLNTKFALKMQRDIIQLQQLGIFHIDMDLRQYINGKIADFSTTFTTPHFLTHPELTPSLPPTAIAAMEYEAFVFSIADYWTFDSMVKHWNSNCENSPKDQVNIFTFPNGKGCQIKYNLRSMPHRERVFTLVDPRSYDWKTSADVVVKRQSSGNASSSRKKPGQGVSKVRQRLPKKPPRWYYNCTPEVAAKLQKKTDYQIYLHWDVIDGEMVPWRLNRPEGETPLHTMPTRPKERDFK